MICCSFTIGRFSIRGGTRASCSRGARRAAASARRRPRGSSPRALPPGPICLYVYTYNGKVLCSILYYHTCIYTYYVRNYRLCRLALQLRLHGLEHLTTTTTITTTTTTATTTTTTTRATTTTTTTTTTATTTTTTTTHNNNNNSNISNNNNISINSYANTRQIAGLEHLLRGGAGQVAVPGEGLIL